MRTTEKPVSAITQESIFEHNLCINFPDNEIAISIEESESRFGPNFKKILKQLRQMPDTFGLCGVIEVTANGLLANYDAWKDVDYDPRKLKKMFEKWQGTQQGESAWMWFNRTYGDRFKEGPNDFAILTENQLETIQPRLNSLNIRLFNAADWDIALETQEANRSETDPEKKLDLILITTSNLQSLFDQFEKDEGIDIAVLCEYPLQKGIHTHWLAARKQAEKDSLLIAGDLKPFGISAAAISVPIGNVFGAMEKVVGATPTTILTNVLAGSANTGRRLHTKEVFLTNLVRRKF